MATLAGILVVVAYNMSEWEHFIALLKGPRSDVAVLLTTFILTVLVDLTVAIEIGMVLAVFLFMRKMIQLWEINIFKRIHDIKLGDWGRHLRSNFKIPTTHLWSNTFIFAEVLKLLKH